MASAARFEKLNERVLPPMPPVQRDHVELRAEAARGDGCAFTVATVDRHAGNALQGFGQVCVRELADVFGVDRVDHAYCIALGLHGSLQASAQTGDHHLFELLARLFLSEHWIDEHCATSNGEQCLRG
jgi:hypothetical protein